MIEIENKKLHDWIVDKDVQVQKGRAISRTIESLDVKIKRFEDKEKKITMKVIPPQELTDRGEEIVKTVQTLDEELNVIIAKINAAKLEAVPVDMKHDHMALLKEREKLERDRNKVALKVQKIKDRCVPVIQKEVKPLLGEYEDIETAKIKDGKVVIATFDRLEDFKKTFRR